MCVCLSVQYICVLSWGNVLARVLVSGDQRYCRAGHMQKQLFLTCSCRRSSRVRRRLERPYIFTSDSPAAVRLSEQNTLTLQLFTCMKNACPSSTLHIHKQAAAREACKAQQAGFIVILQLSTCSQDESEKECHLCLWRSAGK